MNHMKKLNGKKQNVLVNQMRQNETVYLSACAAFAPERKRESEQSGPPAGVRVFRYYDQLDEISADLLTVGDAPRPGVTSYSTLGLLHHSVGLRRGDKPLRIEIAGAALARFEYFPNLLSGCAFDVINSHFRCEDVEKGAVKRDCVKMYIPESECRHLVFLPAALPLWGNTLPELGFEDKTLLWLAAVPVSDGELALFEERGPEALRQALAGAELADLCRRPTVYSNLTK